MTIDAGLLEMLESTVTVAAVSSRAVDGKTAWGTGSPIAAHISRKRQLVRNAQGEEVLSTGSAHLDADYATITEHSRLTLPDGAAPTIVAVETTYDTSGPYQTVVYF